MLVLDLIAVDPRVLIGEDGVACMQVDALLAGNEAARLLEVGRQLLEGAGAARVVARGHDAAGGRIVLLVETHDVVALPAVDGDRLAGQLRQDRLGVDALGGVCLACQFMPYLYAAAGNLDSVGQSLLGVVQWVLVAVCSLAVFSKLGDKVPHRVLFGVSALLALASWVCIAIFGAALNNGTTDSMGWCLWAYVILWGVSAGFSAQCFYALWGTELFPTRYRGGAQGIMFFLVRAALGIWSLVGVGAIMGDISTNPAGFFPAALIMCAVLVVSLVVGVAWCPDTQGKTLDQITEERYGKLQ